MGMRGESEYEYESVCACLCVSVTEIKVRRLRQPNWLDMTLHFFQHQLSPVSLTFIYSCKYR